ncbi:NADP oxidoreductase [Kribbella capetownensis]|uniref:NADP oxidoreductase n=1 Tax=Kribbella capetownensis TaxID=1572659 RepID=A0A4R0JU37_9ACTN|nr:NADP oxidoreductase [Kribbella capetownensis]
MRIGTLGNGLMAEALARHWAREHEVMIGGRDPGRASELAGRIGSQAGTLQEATIFGDVLLLALPAEVAVDAVRGLEIPPGRILIDCTNAIDQQDFTLAEPAMAERIARAVPHVHVVKAFNLAADSVWKRPPDGLGVPLCGDDPAAVTRVGQLISDLGCTPVPAGGLGRGKLLEATAALAIGIWVTGGDVRRMFPPLDAAFGSVRPGQPEAPDREEEIGAGPAEAAEVGPRRRRVGVVEAHENAGCADEAEQHHHSGDQAAPAQPS